MTIIIGLGNPGPEYENTRHNFGFRVLDMLAGTENWESKNHSLVTKVNETIFAKPQTFMNKSGEAVKDSLSYYPDAKLIVVQDELDFPLGTIKIMKNISAAGHNGVKSIIDHIGTQDFIRIRLGIDNPNIRGQIPADDFVLQKFNKTEEQIITEVLEKTKEALGVLQTQGLEIAQSKFNG